MGNQTTYWRNDDSTGVTLHKGTCPHVKRWAKPPKWKEFPTKEAARISTSRAIQKCGDCLPPGGKCTVNGTPPPPPPPPVNCKNVVERMAARVMSEIRENPESDWQSASGRIKREFVGESETLYHLGKCKYPDGDDLIAKTARRQAHRIRNDVVRNMETAFVSEVENAPRNMALWRPVKEDVLRKNNMAIGVLRECDLSAPNGSDLIAEALSKSGLRIVSRYDVMDGVPVEYLAKRQKGSAWLPRALRSLRWIPVAVGLIAAVFALIGLTIWDIVPIPCDFWPFYRLPRCP